MSEGRRPMRGDKRVRLSETAKNMYIVSRDFSRDCTMAQRNRGSQDRRSGATPKGRPAEVRIFRWHEI